MINGHEAYAGREHNDKSKHKVVEFMLDVSSWSSTFLGCLQWSFWMMRMKLCWQMNDVYHNKDNKDTATTKSGDSCCSCSINTISVYASN